MSAPIAWQTASAVELRRVGRRARDAGWQYRRRAGRPPSAWRQRVERADARRSAPSASSCTSQPSGTRSLALPG